MARLLRRPEGTLQHRREQLPWPKDRQFRILSIDGGGIRGILPAAILAEYERRHLGGRSIGDHFDLIAGTSTGGIIALGLSLGIPASVILELYLTRGSEIFPTDTGPLAWLTSKLRAARSLRHYRYDREPLERELRRVFGNRLYGEASRRLCVPSFDGFTEVNVFKTPHHPDFKVDWREQMVTVALATSAAPTFFAVYENEERRFADGGVWANNPVMIALIDALTCYELNRNQIDILSLGCGESAMIFTEPQVRLGGLWYWREIMSSAMRLASENAMGQAGLLIGRDRLVRLDAPAMANGAIRLDDVIRSTEELPPIAHKLADRFEEIVSKRFLATTAEPYPAFHGPRCTSKIN